MNRTFTTVPVKATLFGWMALVALLLVTCLFWADQLLTLLMTIVALVINWMPVVASFVKINLGMMLVGGIGALIPAVVLGKLFRSDRLGNILLAAACLGCLAMHYRAHCSLTPVRQSYVAEITAIYTLPPDSNHGSTQEGDVNKVDRILEERDEWLVKRGYIGLGKWSVRDGRPITEMGYIYVTPVISKFLSSKS